LAIDLKGFMPSNPAADPSESILSASLRVFLILIRRSCGNNLNLAIIEYVLFFMAKDTYDARCIKPKNNKIKAI
jgi:hypothetical protein